MITYSFNLYINKLAIQLKDLNYGVDIGGKNVSLLLYADDIDSFAENENDLFFSLPSANPTRFY